uniref:Uncharacterized protein n=1 Tax=viral metagenome TaxID=1070528 RepID=A0A6C0F4T8_9ZZZZ
MPCSISCSFALIFIVSMIYMHNAASKSSTMQNYQKQLPADLQNLYKKIVNERLGIYYFGYVLGFILSAIIIFYNYSIRKGKSGGLSTASIVCIVIAVSFLTNYFYYILSPKTNWMLDHIKGEDQTKAWLKMYRNMQVYYHSGLVLGIIAVAFFALAFRC